ncbi:hypothetical protein NSK_002034 [Nannochloropsis salina CCMP1776]|uniref:Uncharacterized protein n=1 Tax=Nannochloropsis salina CCMP1776 TaxID=1027361 RepID=A0A4D9D6E3_9STRA|nr:hypothetical protein NSK_002034 [Nannochloropsis salina CCMP1776]|eukprot:TFJ86946.1 hypothetical protein NSK_002034 [Nannochloropsis salina CCMP1776]
MLLEAAGGFAQAYCEGAAGAARAGHGLSDGGLPVGLVLMLSGLTATILSILRHRKRRLLELDRCSARTTDESSVASGGEVFELQPGPFGCREKRAPLFDLGDLL